MAGERTEQASPQRRDKARKDGDLVHSRELCSAAGTVAGVMLLGVGGPKFVAVWTRSIGDFIGFGAMTAWEPGTIDQTMRSLTSLAMTVMAPVGLVAAGVTGAALGAGVLQTGGIQIHPQVLGWKLDRISPLSNLKNLFSLRSASRLAKSMIPAAMLAIFAVQRIGRQWDMPPFSSVRLVALGADVYQLLLATAWLLFSWAAIDYLVEWRSREQRLKMSREEMRDEYKESEGNPQIRGRIRNLQRQARRRRVRTDVSKAAVVITNPTHYAVALDFDFETMDAPKVLAKGRNLMAEEIKEQARWAGVPILENPPLARSLFKSVEAGEPIPVALYAAVASILAFLYRQRVEQEMRSRRERAAKAGAARPGHRTSPSTTGEAAGQNTAGIIRGMGWTGKGPAEKARPGQHQPRQHHPGQRQPSQQQSGQHQPGDPLPDSKNQRGDSNPLPAGIQPLTENRLQPGEEEE